MECKECGFRMHKCEEFTQEDMDPKSTHVIKKESSGCVAQALKRHRVGNWFVCLVCDITIPMKGGK